MFIKDLLFPKICLGCGYLGAYICVSCQNKLKHIEKDTCLYCEGQSYFGLTHPKCQKKYGVDGLVAIFYYNDLLKKIIKSIKYRLVTEALRELCISIKPERLKKLVFYQKMASNFFVQPIPLHPRRQRSRGFNQASVIADFFNQFLSLARSNFLIRKKETLPQAQIIKSKKRHLNIKGAFEASGHYVIHKNFILIDDVVTTGATVKEAARALKLQGATKVFVLAIARG